MARAIRRGFSRGSARGVRRKTQWSLGPGGDDLATLDAVGISSSTTVIIGSGVTPAVSQLTVVRLHGHLEFALSSAVAALGGFSFAYGIGIVTSDAFAIGVTAVPNPFDDIDWPGWLVHGSGAIRSVVGALAVGDPSINPLVVPLESKSMRILRLNEIMFLAVQAGESGTANVNVRGMTRLLVKLP